MKAFVPEDYVTHADTNSPLKRGFDVALLRPSKRYTNVEKHQSSAISRFTNKKPVFLRLNGYGNTSDGGGAGLLQTGHFTNLSWYTSGNETYYRSVYSDYGANNAHACSGDSGGPMKLTTLDSGIAGITFGVFSGYVGTPSCGEDASISAMTAYHDGWMEQIIEDGRGSCSRVTLDAWHQNGTVTSVGSLRCW